ncbi:MAG: hypothetical protein HY854_25655 [Burkholderiales bacterium]|nr:hypothetical protein [Burkholderiales bacterium]
MSWPHCVSTLASITTCSCAVPPLRPPAPPVGAATGVNTMFTAARSVLHYGKPWSSQVDISAGDRWAQEVDKQLEASNSGIICVTPENFNLAWILFEAGALGQIA